MYLLILLSCFGAALGNMYAVVRTEPHGSSEQILVIGDKAWVTGKHERSVVTNVGKVSCIARLMFENTWTHNVEEEMSETVEPGETKYLYFKENQYKTEVRIDNPNDRHSIVMVTRGSNVEGRPYYGGLEVPYKEFGIEAARLPKKLLEAAESEDADPDEVIEMILETFWPEDKGSIWDVILPKLKNVIPEATYNIIVKNKQQYLKSLKSKLGEAIWDEEDEDGDARSYYMSTARGLFTFESKFVFSNEKGVNINYYMLPFYSQVICMQISFYTVGIAFREKYGLTEDDVRSIKKYRSELLKSAKDLIFDTFDEQLSIVYTKDDPNLFFDNTMKTHTYATVNGLEYIPYWENIVEPEKYPKVINDQIAYSEYFGLASPGLYKESVVYMGIYPLTPIYYNSNPNLRKLISVTFYTQNDVIYNAKVGFDNDRYFMFSLEDDILKPETIELGDQYIDKVDVGGDEMVEFLILHLSDGSEKRVGKGFQAKLKTFELPGHHVASFFMSFSNTQLTNIAVSYQLYPEKDE